MRFFNTEGPVVPEGHYSVPPLQRWDLEEVLTLIAQKKYFLLHAPRQTGKTTCLLVLANYLNREGRYRAVYANLEGAQAYREQVDRALALAKAVAARDSYAAAVLLAAYEKDKAGASALLADFRAVAAAGLRGSSHSPVEGETARKALGAADAAMQQIGAQVNPKIVLSVLAAKFRTF